MQISGRNKITGTVTNVNPGTVNSEVEIETPGGDKIVGMITKSSQESMKITEGEQITALIKASSVMFIKE
ncbi:TOBE domain-containing protein [Natranaerobius thermophilus]|uniref:TOBE domain protein n=1 Tax=Natranaerobius thermophilus (strain ATCC BAA-1301 / DSM 18059 / JW/NM-WN-LF) TaxID=457570 RepID=B2A5A3_NATTJ|nr:TOBE domain-containing protein [Natranaerobius thermophilus]ACB83937.1 TOBE domain protein [Natranaerobius thermophilus JW/NM-WN-LF]